MKSGHILLEHGSEFTLFSPGKDGQFRLAIISQYMNKAAVMFVARLLSAQGLRRLQQRMITAAMNIAGLDSSTKSPSGSWRSSMRYVLPRGMSDQGTTTGTAVMVQPFKDRNGKAMRYRVALYILHGLGLDRFNGLLKLLGASYRISPMSDSDDITRWILACPNPRAAGEQRFVFLPYYLQYNELHRERNLSSAMQELEVMMRSREEADSSGLLAALWNGVDSTNDEPSAKRDRLLRFLAVAKAKFPREIDLLGRIKSDANSNDARIRNVWSKNISILIDCISDLSEDERPERLSWTWIPDVRDVGDSVFSWYKRQLGYTPEG